MAQPSLTETMPQSPQKLVERPSTANRPILSDIPISSPLQAQGDSGLLRRAYFDWQKTRNPSEKDAIEGAFIRVDEELYYLKDTHSFKKPDWAELKVPLGLGRRLSGQVKEFLLEGRVAAAAAAAADTRRGRSGLDDLAAAARKLGGQLSDISEGDGDDNIEHR